MDGTGTWADGPRDGPRHGPADGAAGDLRVDTAELEDGSGRLARAADDLAAAEEGLARVPVAGVATGADALLDALADLGRQWSEQLDGAAGQARVLRQALALAAADYARTEQEAARGLDLDSLLLPGTPRPGRPEHPAQDRVPGPVPVLGPPTSAGVPVPVGDPAPAP